MFTDSAGNSYVVGISDGLDTIDSFTINTSNRTFFIAKFNSAGNTQWLKQAVCNGYSTASATGICSDNFGYFYITGSFSYTTAIGTQSLTTYSGGSNASDNMFIAKFDTAGNFYWAKKAGGSQGASGNGICTDNFGNIYVSGTFIDTAMFDNTALISKGNSDAFIAKYDSSGTLKWVKQVGGNSQSNQSGTSNAGITSDKNNNIFISGIFSSDTIWFDTVALAKSGPIGEESIYIAKYDSMGVFHWAKSGDALGSNNERCKTLKADKHGNVYITGAFYGTLNVDTLSITSSLPFNYLIFILKIDSTGNCLWLKKAGGIGSNIYNSAMKILIGSENKVYLVGGYDGTAYFDNVVLSPSGSGYVHMFLAEYDTLGNCNKALKASGWTVGSGMGVDTYGNIYISGSFSSNSTFGDIVLAWPYSGSDPKFFLTKVSPTFTTINSIGSIKEKFKLYPNPSADYVTLSYSVNKSSSIKLFLTDVLGSPIYMEDLGYINPGNHSFDFSHRNFSSGIYLIHLQIDSETITKKLVISK